MICRNCGKQIKNTGSDKCPECKMSFRSRIEGNGFFDILSERASSAEGARAAGGNGLNTASSDYLQKSQKETRMLAKKWMDFGKIIAVVGAVAVLLSVISLFYCINLGGKIDSLGKKLDEVSTELQEVNKDFSKLEDSYEELGKKVSDMENSVYDDEKTEFCNKIIDNVTETVTATESVLCNLFSE